MTSLLQSVASSGSEPGLSVVHAHFGLYFPPPMSVSVAVSGLVILVGAWNVGSAPAPAGGLVLLASLVGTTG